MIECIKRYMLDEQGGGAVFLENNSIPRPKYGNNIMHSDPNMSASAAAMDDEEFQQRQSSVSVATSTPGGFYDHGRLSGEGSPMMMSPWNQTTPFTKSPWSSTTSCEENSIPQNTLIGSLMREEGHIYSLAASGDLLYTGSDSKNIRVWKNLKEFSAFKSSSGLVKAIIVSNGKIFTGHQDGKIRVWKVSPKAPNVHKRAGSLPTLKDIFKSSMNPSNYIQEVKKKRRNALWIKHSDAVSCLSLNEKDGLLYSASWDRTIKVWRMSDSKCLESITSHDDAVNVVIAASVEDGQLVFSGSADGTVKVWKCEVLTKGTTKHTLVETLLKQECAVTSLTVTMDCSVIYCGSSDGLVNYWERQKQPQFNFSHGGVLRGHKLAVLCLSSAGSVVFSGSADKTICVWRRDGSIHTCLSVLSGHTGPVKCLAVEADPESSKNIGDQRWILYSGSLDKSVKVWSVSELTFDVNIGMAQPPLAGSDDAPSEGSFSSERASQKQRASNF